MNENQYIVFKEGMEPHVVTEPIPEYVRQPGVIIKGSNEWFFWAPTKPYGHTWRVLADDLVPPEHRTWVLLLS